MRRHVLEMRRDLFRRHVFHTQFAEQSLSCPHNLRRMEFRLRTSCQRLLRSTVQIVEKPCLHLSPMASTYGTGIGVRQQVQHSKTFPIRDNGDEVANGLRQREVAQTRGLCHE